MPKKPSFNYFKRASAEKGIKKPQKRNMARNLRHMTIVLISNHFKTTINILNSIVCQVSCQTHQVLTTLRE